MEPSPPIPAQPIKLRLRWPHYLAFALLLVGLVHLTSPHRRSFLVPYSMAAVLAYGFFRPRESGQTHWEYVRDPGNATMMALAVLGGSVYVYFLMTGHF